MRDVKEAYRRVFSSPEGQRVLAHMLVSLGFFNEIPPESTEEIARQNYARELLRILGMLTDNAGEVQELIKGWFDIGRRKERGVKNER